MRRRGATGSRDGRFGHSGRSRSALMSLLGGSEPQVETCDVVPQVTATCSGARSLGRPTSGTFRITLLDERFDGPWFGPSVWIGARSSGAADGRVA